ncbi:hypothetical protein [Terribacillus halophilus]|uniref:hypothetical protein n=1 Tax=Terribacillus halophilus TaxID=361279 RepID=UPI0039829554
MFNDFDRFFGEEKILNGQISDVTKQLNSFTNFINDNMEAIGESISNNLVDRLKEASEAFNVIVKENTTGKSVSSFDTGGYTGKWGSTGKLAMLHEKELVLNENDTSNLFKAVKEVRGLVNVKTPQVPDRQITNNNSSDTIFNITMHNKIEGHENPGDEITKTFVKEMANYGVICRP